MFGRLALIATVLLSASQAVAGPNFVRDVVPILTKAGCNGGKCHGSFQGRGGFRLSLLGFDAAADHQALVTEARGRRISLTAPEQSLILRKAGGRVPHGGGRRFDESEPAWTILREWIRNGTPRPDSTLAVQRLEMNSTDVVLETSGQSSLTVTARWSDGRTTDATPWAVYEVRDETLAEVDASGIVHAIRPGRTAVTVTFMGQVSAVTVTVPYSQSVELADFQPRNDIDRLIAAEWQKVGLSPTSAADDATFLRRASLDITGTLPTPDEIRAFLADGAADKREQLIDQLLQRPEYVDCWSTKWGDLLRVHRRYLGDKGLWSFHGWVRTAVRGNWPVDRMARELITSRGSLFTNGATGYYYIDKRPEDLAETTSQVFLGIRLQCARCHHHPYEVWSQQDYYGLASFFTRLQIKDNGDGARYGGTKLLRPIATVPKERRLKVKADPRAFGQPVDLTQTNDARVELADWITDAANPWFARNFVNRYWAHLMGRGIVEPVDDLRATNPPSHPELLDRLAADFVEHNYDTKHLIRTICNSRIYHLSHRVVAERDTDGMFFTHRQFRRMPAAVMLDAVNQACETSEDFTGLPRGTRAQALPDPQIPSYFLTTFGRSIRNSPCECSTSTSPNLSQALHLINSTVMGSKVSDDNGRVARLVKTDLSDAAIAEELYLATFSRPPTEEEISTVVSFVKTADSRRVAFEDVLWALINASSFVFNY